MNYSKMLGGSLSFKDAINIDLELQHKAPDLSVQQREDICKIFERRILDSETDLSDELDNQESYFSFEIEALGKQISDLEDDNTILNQRIVSLEEELEKYKKQSSEEVSQ